MFDVFVFIQIDQYRLCLSISAVNFDPALVQFKQSNSLDWLNVCYLRSLTKIEFFLVPDSCSATIINGNSTRADFTEDTVKTIRTTLVSALFRQFNSCFVCF